MLASIFVHLQNKFLSTLSLRRATRTGSSWAAWFPFLSTLSLRRATGGHQKQDGIFGISIHALLAESDTSQVPTWFGIPNFYPRSPCGERPLVPHQQKSGNRFLSTLSLRRATSVYRTSNSSVSNFYPRSPCGERPGCNAVDDIPVTISIHALLAESDTSQVPTWFGIPNFYPRSPCGERLSALYASCPRSHFYPRSPCGERRA